MLLDAAFAQPSKFIKANKKANIIHIFLDLGISRQTDDSEIYKLAKKDNRFVVTHDNDFKKLVRKSGAGVIIIPAHLSTNQVDKLLLKFVSRNNPEEYKGKYVRLQ